MGTSLRTLLTALLASLVGGVVGGAATVSYGSMPLWAGWSHVSVGPTSADSAYSLGGVVGQVQHTAQPNGGPQAFECYTYDDHPVGVTRLVMGCIGNVELAGAGVTTEVRPVQSGGVIRGAGSVEEWTAFTVHRPQEQHPGQIRRFNAIKFGNGWTFVEDGDKLFLCPPRSDRCHSF